MKKYAKAVAAAIGSLSVALADGHVTGAEWCLVALSVFAVFGISNTPTEPGEDGAVNLGPVLTVTAVLVLVLVLLSLLGHPAHVR